MKFEWIVELELDVFGVSICLCAIPYAKNCVYGEIFRLTSPMEMARDTDEW